jgi:hypothetical protein
MGASMDNDQAACKDSVDAYNLAFSKSVADATTMIAEYCFACPIRMTCLMDAIANDAYGVWGGNTRQQRLELAGILKLGGIKRQAI